MNMVDKEKLMEALELNTQLMEVAYRIREMRERAAKAAIEWA